MALFGLFKKKEAEVPKPSGALKLDLTAPPARHKDDLEKPTPVLQGPLFPDIPKLELPELEAPEKEESDLDKIKLPEFKIPELPKAEKPEETLFELPELELPELEEAGISKPKEVSHMEIAKELEAPESLPDIEEFEYRPKKQKPVFMDIRRYSEMIEQLNQMKTKIMDYANVSTKMAELKDEKEKAMEKYRYSLEDIERKLLYIDRVFFEGG